MPQHPHQNIILSNTDAFARHVCQAIEDMLGLSYMIENTFFCESQFSPKYNVSAFISFSGTVQGEYLLALDPKTAVKLLDSDIERECITCDTLKCRRCDYMDLLKEILNLSVGQAIETLGKRYGELTFTSATIIHGELDLPPYLSGISKLKGPYGDIQCGFFLNLAKLKIGETLAQTLAELKELNENLELKVAKRTQELHESNIKLHETMDALWGEMKLAKKIQTALLPSEINLPGYEISASLDPAEDVGGDYYDLITIDNHIYLFIGDVSGHGVPAGLVMMMAQTAIRAIIANTPKVSLPGLLAAANDVLIHNIEKLDEKKYMTITALHSFGNGVFTFSGLHQDILIYRADINDVQNVETNGMWLGVMPEIHNFSKTETIFLNRKDVMVLFTDGVTEARDTNDKMFGVSRLKSLLRENGKKSAADIRKTILKDLALYHQDDDMTIIVVKRLE